MSHESTPLSSLSMNRPLPNSPSSWRSGPGLNQQHASEHQPSPELKRYQLTDNPVPLSSTPTGNGLPRARPQSVIGSSTLTQYQQPTSTSADQQDRPSIRRTHKSAQSLSSLSSILRPQSPASVGTTSPSMVFHSSQMERGASDSRFGHRSNTISANTSPLIPHSANPSPDLRGMTVSPSSFSGGWAATGHGREYEDIQNRTFCKWLNARLEPAGYPTVSDLGADFADGTRLIQLLEILTEIPLGKHNREPVLRVQKMENAKKALDRIKEMGVQLTNIGPEDVVDGNRKLMLGMIWSLVLRFSIADINEEGSHAKEGLLLWCQRKTHDYDEVDIQNFHRSFQDGLALCALIHRHRPDLLDYNSLDKSPAAGPPNTRLAFQIAERSLGIPQLLEVEDVCGSKKPDERSVMTYVAQFFHAFSSKQREETEARVIGEFVETMSELMLGIHDYERRMNALLDTIQERLTELEAPLSEARTYPTLVAARARLAGPRKQLSGERLAVAALLRNVQTKLKTYGLRGYDPPEGLTIDNLTVAWSVWVEAEQARKRELTARIIQIQDDLRARMAKLANQVDATLELATSDLGMIEGTLADQLVAARAIEERLVDPELVDDLARLSQVEGECLACEVDDQSNGLTIHDSDSLESTRSQIRKSVADRISFVENQVVARSMTNVTAEQKEEFESAFRAFDKDESNTLNMDELAGALAALGISDINLDEIQAHVGGEDEVGFEPFLRFLVERAEDRLTGAKVRNCFRSAANEKEYMTELDLARLELPARAVEFLRERMELAPLDGGAEGAGPGEAEGTVAFDFEEFLDRFLE